MVKQHPSTNSRTTGERVRKTSAAGSSSTYLGELLLRSRDQVSEKRREGIAGLKRSGVRSGDIKDDHSSIAREGEEEREEAGLG